MSSLCAYRKTQSRWGVLPAAASYIPRAPHTYMKRDDFTSNTTWQRTQRNHHCSGVAQICLRRESEYNRVRKFICSALHEFIHACMSRLRSCSQSIGTPINPNSMCHYMPHITKQKWAYVFCVYTCNSCCVTLSISQCRTQHSVHEAISLCWFIHENSHMRRCGIPVSPGTQRTDTK